MRAKQFFYVAAGILLLVVAYSIGARRAEAQLGSQFAGITTGGSGTMAITTSGDVYARNAIPVCLGPGNYAWWNGPAMECNNEWIYMGNVLGGTIATTPATISGVKQEYRK